MKEPTTDFPYAEIDGEHKEPTATELAGEAFGRMMAWVWEDPCYSSAFRKFIAVTAVVKPELLGNDTYEQIGKKSGCGKAAISRSAVAFSDHFGLHYRRSRNGRGNMAEARKLSIKKN